MKGGDSMGGIGSGRSRRKDVELVCKWSECKLPFTAKRVDAEYCCKTCRDAAVARQNLLNSQLLIKCRVCGTYINPLLVRFHFKNAHNIDINITCKN